MARIIASTATCVGAGQCVLTAPELFDQDDDGIVLVLRDRPGPDQAAAAAVASDVCPSRSITVDDG